MVIHQLSPIQKRISDVECYSLIGTELPKRLSTPLAATLLDLEMTERRNAPRLRTLKGGSIMFGVAAAIDCIIRNMSEMGAALEVNSPIGIPDEFTLLIKPEFVKRNCRVIWRSAKRIGVQFV